MTGRIALVTGGTRGIGRAISEGLKKAGHRVVANYGGNDAIAQAFTAETGIPAYKFDVGDFAACQAAVAKISAEIGQIEILVNNAGITRDATMKRLSRDMWDQVIDTNLGSCYNLSKCVWDAMLEKGFGRIVNIGSVNGQMGQYGQVNYAAAKSGIHGFTKALAQEGAAKGITVNAIAPGYFPTEANAGIRADPKFHEAVCRRTPAGRWGELAELGAAAVFLSSTAAAYCTGSVVTVDGGLLATF